jgi:histidinol-phosphate/aromatic aminotransferase/cobyric acid decarboxylase-like protein
MTKAEMKAYIEEHCQANSTVIVDESMIYWDREWRDQSLTGEFDWVRSMFDDRQVAVWVMISWTKIWSCPGIRLGSVVAPTPAHMTELKRKQVPWSVNCAALTFMAEVVKDTDFMERTWELTPQWNRTLQDSIKELFPDWTIHGMEYLSWLWIDTHSAEATETVVTACKAAGTPVRSGKPGYNMPSYFRVAVRRPESTEVLVNALKNAFGK